MGRIVLGTTVLKLENGLGRDDGLMTISRPDTWIMGLREARSREFPLSELHCASVT